MKHVILIISIIIPSISFTMEEQLPYQMTIENQLKVKMFLNVEDPNLITEKSPYAYIEGQKTKSFSIFQDQPQSIAFPGHWPNKVKLPIDKPATHFIIKNHPADRNKTLLTDDSHKVIAELLILSNAK